MLIFETGLWVGKGSVLIEGNSLGQNIGFDLTIREEADGLNLTGTCDGFLNAPLSARIAKNEFGVYVIDVALGDLSMEGTAKLESEPALALLWKQSEESCASLTLFRVSDGFGCRGFFREPAGTQTWEIKFVKKVKVDGGANVFSLAKRRR